MWFPIARACFDIRWQTAPLAEVYVYSMSTSNSIIRGLASIYWNAYGTRPITLKCRPYFNMTIQDMYNYNYWYTYYIGYFPPLHICGIFGWIFNITL